MLYRAYYSGGPFFHSTPTLGLSGMEKIPLAEFQVEWSGKQVVALHFAWFCFSIPLPPRKVVEWKKFHEFSTGIPVEFSWKTRPCIAFCNVFGAAVVLIRACDTRDTRDTRLSVEQKKLKSFDFIG